MRISGSIPAMWTYRALERAGYRVVAPGEAQTCVEVRHEGGVIVWHIQGADTVRCDTVEALLARLHQVEMKGTGDASRHLL
jgi:hypothetical protein